MRETDSGGNWGLFMGGSILSKSLIKFSVEQWDCLPSLLFDLRQNYDRGNYGNGYRLQKDLGSHCCIQLPWPAAGLCQPTLPPETPGISPVSWYAQDFVCALQESLSPVLWKFYNQIPLASSLAPWKKSYDQTRHHIERQRHYFANRVHLVRAMIFSVVVYGCESWTIKKAEHWKIDAFELWCWRRLLRVPWTERGSNQSILEEISHEYSLEWLMLKLQYFGHLMWRIESLEKIVFNFFVFNFLISVPFKDLW